MQTTAEQLRSHELGPTLREESEGVLNTITKQEVESIYRERKHSLEQVRSSLCLKFFYSISDKLKQEKKLFEKILHWEDAKQEALSRYSFVLNQYYFEQRFLQ